ncbi:MAG TPA: hypothetical protein VIM94_07500 [Salegentibacter sp.]|uniref:hypothetical protein n=1 Tax=Salegentibacter sp. TaxID=1903072 RepID=UPI002F948790
MAEIKIEKKRPVWPWVILIIVILGILAYVFLYTDIFIEDTDNTDDIEELNDNTTMYNSQDKEIGFPKRKA